MKKAITFIAGFVVGIIALSAWGHIFNKSNTDSLQLVVDSAKNDETTKVEDESNVTTTTTTTMKADTKVVQNTKVAEALPINDAVAVEKQVAGNTVTIKSVNLQAGANGGWVVVHEVKKMG